MNQATLYKMLAGWVDTVFWNSEMSASRVARRITTTTKFPKFRFDWRFQIEFSQLKNISITYQIQRMALNCIFGVCVSIFGFSPTNEFNCRLAIPILQSSMGLRRHLSISYLPGSAVVVGFEENRTAWMQNDDTDDENLVVVLLRCNVFSPPYRRCFPCFESPP